MKYPELKSLISPRFVTEGTEYRAESAIRHMVREKVADIRKGADACDLEDSIRAAMDAQSLVIAFCDELPVPVEEELEDLITDAITDSVKTFGTQCQLGVK